MRTNPKHGQMSKILQIGGIDVVDAKRPITFEITKRDVTTGDKKDPGNCAAARACQRELKATEARVYLTRTYLKTKGKWVRYRTPGSIRNEIIAFDRGGTFEPGSYTLTPMPDSLRLGARRNPGPKKTAGKKKRAYHTTVHVRASAGKDLAMVGA